MEEKKEESWPLPVKKSTNFICHIFNRSTKDRQYFREGGVYRSNRDDHNLDKYFVDFLSKYIDEGIDENQCYFISQVNMYDYNTFIKLYGTPEKKDRIDFVKEEIKPYINNFKQNIIKKINAKLKE
jgi:hypothetical protein